MKQRFKFIHPLPEESAMNKVFNEEVSIGTILTIDIHKGRNKSPFAGTITSPKAWKGTQIGTTLLESFEKIQRKK